MGLFENGQFLLVYLYSMVYFSSGKGSAASLDQGKLKL